MAQIHNLNCSMSSGLVQDFPGGSDSKEPAYSEGDRALTP